MNRSGLGGAAASVIAAVPVSGQVKVTAEAAGHYHRPVLDHLWPDGWEVSELNPAHVAQQRSRTGPTPGQD